MERVQRQNTLQDLVVIVVLLIQDQDLTIRVVGLTERVVEVSIRITTQANEKHGSHDDCE